MMLKRLLLLALVVIAWVLYAALSTSPKVEAITEAQPSDTTRNAIVQDTAQKTASPAAKVPRTDTTKVRPQLPSSSEPTEKSAPAACDLSGITFNEHAPGRDKLTFTRSGGGRINATGQINSMSVTGSFRVSGTSLTAVPGSGLNILSGTLSLSNGCAKLSGNVSVKSAASGKPVSLPVDLFDPMKGG